MTVLGELHCLVCCIALGVSWSDYFMYSPGPSTQTNIERSADGINEVIIFGAGPSADNSITVQFDLTDDDVALEDVEQYFVSLSVPPGSGALVVQPERTQINVLDDDG